MASTSGFSAYKDGELHPSTFHVMLKPRGAICNLDCRYCFYLAKEQLYPDSRFRMSDELLEFYTEQYIKSHQESEITFAWQGGEPTLMGLEFFQRAVELQEKYCPPGMRIYNSLQTNGTTLTDEWCQFFRENHFLIGISLDGPEELHNAYRVNKAGNPTFIEVIHGISNLKRYHVQFNILACVQSANVDYPVDVYRFLRDEVGAQFLQFIPIVQPEEQMPSENGTAVSKYSVTGGGYGSFLIAVFEEWIRRDVGKVFVQTFDVALAAWADLPPGLCVFSETCGQALAMEHSGDLYSCDHFVNPHYYLGNILEDDLMKLITSPQQKAFGEAKRLSLPTYCWSCPVRFVCNGGCPKNRFVSTPDGKPGLNYLCEGYRRFFNHIGLTQLNAK